MAEELMWKEPEVVCAFVGRWTSENEKKNPKHTECYKKNKADAFIVACFKTQTRQDCLMFKSFSHLSSCSSVNQGKKHLSNTGSHYQ